MSLDFDFFSASSQDHLNNSLIKYLKNQHPEVLSRIAESASSEVQQIISHNVAGMIGKLPESDFDIQITTGRQQLANLLASAMMTGYFLGKVEQRKNLDKSLSDNDSSS